MRAGCLRSWGSARQKLNTCSSISRFTFPSNPNSFFSLGKY
ncbi:hypothetical protein FHS21_005523 [Phyllobacterium trifolii]|uniref:Uncharacterized protein n=1 Tax=Phyllobacterium trifolii TaxID=300193 RepID=A0A839UGY2_9HYPH|nr:hypothetical protein [Phyllobacterium trifolii]